ncbi:MAG: hypothetical protein ACLR7U_08310 [Ruthenibacterium lactatiformans]
MMIFKGRNRVTSGFRLSARPNHNGIDIVGTMIKQARRRGRHGGVWALCPKARAA